MIRPCPERHQELATEGRDGEPARDRAGEPACVFHFMRHGATEHNLRGLRCGGELDVPLCDAGREQARQAGLALQARGVAVRRIITSALARTRESAAIAAAVLGGPPIEIEPLLNERRLGAWNARPVAETEWLIAAKVPPPGGEAEGDFAARIEQALMRIRPCLEAGDVLMVSSKGVARVLNLLLGGDRAPALANGGITRFTLGPLLQPARSGSCTPPHPVNPDSCPPLHLPNAGVPLGSR